VPLEDACRTGRYGRPIAAIPRKCYRNPPVLRANSTGRPDIPLQEPDAGSYDPLCAFAGVAGGSTFHHHCGSSGFRLGYVSFSVAASYTRPFFIT